VHYEKLIGPATPPYGLLLGQMQELIGARLGSVCIESYSLGLRKPHRALIVPFVPIVSIAWR
jgi:hypothetical protein